MLLNVRLKVSSTDSCFRHNILWSTILNSIQTRLFYHDDVSNTYVSQLLDLEANIFIGQAAEGYCDILTLQSIDNPIM